MAGFWDYFRDMTQQYNATRQMLFDRQFNVANMWRENANQESQATRDYLNLKQGLFGKKIDIAKLAEDKEQFNKTYGFNVDKLQQEMANYDKDRANRLAIQKMSDDAQIKSAGITASASVANRDYDAAIKDRDTLLSLLTSKDFFLLPQTMQQGILNNLWGK